ncbi:D-lactonohydrolase-like protein-like protein [Microdochium trichocladiopsis]|uniref:D-lactonohydrolase-like protein-like protein n=1 Tax=Microdochium trichocladiopsis TaxID=1682393 RepID=A0A9P8YBN5_9PEZI|nr:D-lactonohydrolase-like protein-like protein [Microdochium trichocladiopsis]KAH7035528.1 D-lactonohydrolase-like protein-like protein [Microdochium trichocladiopsis]
MATVTNSKIRADLLQVEVSNNSARSAPAANPTPHDSRAFPAGHLGLRQYQPAFSRIIGEKPTQSLLFSTADTSRIRFFHGGCVYVHERDEIYTMSDLLPTANSSLLPSIVMSRISVKVRGVEAEGDRHPDAEARPHVLSAEWAKLRPPANMPMPAGACAQTDGILFCSQGNLTPGTGGVYYMPLGRQPVAVVTNFAGRPFNSLQGITCDKGSGLWFTDSDRGHLHGIRPKPELRSQVYRYDTATGDLRVVADGLGRPSALVLSPDGQTMYITDVESQGMDGTFDQALYVIRCRRQMHSEYVLTGYLVSFTYRAATIYAYDVVQRSGGVFLANKRVFAYAAKGVPSAVACDSVGNVYAACGDGVEVWSAGGLALGLLMVPGGCSGICFGRDNELFVCTGQALWRVQLNNIKGEGEG